MQEYEILYILKPNQSEADYTAASDRIDGWITKTKGTVLAKESIGVRDLAYEIKKQTKGFYGITQFQGEKPTLDELEKRLRLDPVFLRHLVVKLESVKRMHTAAPAEESQAKEAPAEEAASEETPDESSKKKVAAEAE